MFVIGQIRKMPIYDCPKNAVYTSPYTQKKGAARTITFCNSPSIKFLI